MQQQEEEEAVVEEEEAEEEKFAKFFKILRSQPHTASALFFWCLPQVFLLWRSRDRI